MDIQEVTKRNKTYNIFLKEAINKANKMLIQGEEVLYAIGGNISIINNEDILKIDFWKIKGKIAGVLVITNKRIIFCNSALGVGQTKEILLKNLQSVDSKDVSFLGIGKLRIKGMTETFLMDVSGKKTIEEAKKAIYSVQEGTIKNQLSNADEILKFKRLLDEEIITQEEFERKKQELLR